MYIQKGSIKFSSKFQQSQHRLEQDPLQVDILKELCTRLELQEMLKENPNLNLRLVVIKPADADDNRPPTSQEPELQAMIDKHKHLFRSSLLHKLPKKRPVKYLIDTQDLKPVNQSPYQLSAAQYEEQQRQVKELLDRGLIEESISPWGSPVLLVPKPGGKQRMCVDYRALNDVTVKDTYPLPRIQECLDAFKGSKYFTKIDLTSGFWQLLIRAQDRFKTAFNTR